jgi:ketosteroid isomerase-like protein
MTEPISLRVAKGFIDALAGFDFDTLSECLSENFVFELPTAPAGMPKRIQGCQEFLDFLSKASTMWSGLRLPQCELYLAADDPSRVFLEYQSEAVNSDGSIYRNTYISRAVVHDGLVSRFCEMMDPEPLADSLTKLRTLSDSKDVAGQCAR